MNLLRHREGNQPWWKLDYKAKVMVCYTQTLSTGSVWFLTKHDTGEKDVSRFPNQRYYERAMTGENTGAKEREWCIY